MKLIIIFVILFLELGAWSQAQPVFGANGRKSLELPTSLSYQTIVQCFSQLENPMNSKKVSLNILREDIDRKIGSLSKVNKNRVVIYKMPNGDIRRLRIGRVKQGAKFDYVLEVEKKNDKGFEALPFPKEHKLNPSNEVVNRYLQAGVVQSDENTFVDTKFNGITFEYTAERLNVLKLELLDTVQHKKLTCDIREKDLVICACLKNTK